MSQSEFDEAVASFKTAQVRMNEHNSAIGSELDRLALLSPVAYAQERKTVAARFAMPTAFLDKEIEERKRRLLPAPTQGMGQPLNLPNIELAEDPVDGSQLLSRLTAVLERYLVLAPCVALAIALWILRAHADDCFDANPRLAILSPEKRCGKTTLLEILAKLVPRALPASNVTPSVIFFAIEAAHPTLLIDEVDSFMDAHEELRGILNSGHRRETAKVIRNVGDHHEPRSFSTWCPMVLAAIGHLPGTLEDRSVIVPMRRRAPHEPLQRLRWTGRAGHTLQAELHTLARSLARWVFDHHPNLMQAEPVVPDMLNDHAADNWTPLLTIAEEIGGDWPDRRARPREYWEGILIRLLHLRAFVSLRIFGISSGQRKVTGLARSNSANYWSTSRNVRGGNGPEASRLPPIVWPSSSVLTTSSRVPFAMGRQSSRDIIQTCLQTPSPGTSGRQILPLCLKTYFRIVTALQHP